MIEDLPASEGVIDFSKTISVPEWKLVMQGGEEFILVLVIPKKRWGDATEIARKMYVPLKKIGYASAGAGVHYESSEGTLEISAAGYDNFREWE